MTWTRGSGTAGDITGTWTAVEPSGDSYQVTFNSDGSWSVVGTLISVENQNPSADSQHWSNGYYVHPQYDDPNKTATSVTVTGPGIAGSLSLAYNTDYQEWESWTLPVYFGPTHPAAPLALYLHDKGCIRDKDSHGHSRVLYGVFCHKPLRSKG